MKKNTYSHNGAFFRIPIKSFKTLRRGVLDFPVSTKGLFSFHYLQQKRLTKTRQTAHLYYI